MIMVWRDDAGARFPGLRVVPRMGGVCPSQDGSLAVPQCSMDLGESHGNVFRRPSAVAWGTCKTRRPRKRLSRTATVLRSAARIFSSISTLIRGFTRHRVPADDEKGL